MHVMDKDFEEFEADEDFPDISAIYVLGKERPEEKLDCRNPEMSEKIRLAFVEAAKTARRKHKEAGLPMIVSRDGKIVYIQPDEIEVE